MEVCEVVSLQGAGILLTTGTLGHTTTDTTGAKQKKDFWLSQKVDCQNNSSSFREFTNAAKSGATQSYPASSFDFEHSEMSINHSISTNMICETHCRRTVLKTVVISCAPCAIKLTFLMWFT